MSREMEILDILKRLTEIPGITDTKKEEEAALYIEEILKEQEYFKDRTAGQMSGQCGRFPIPGDYLGRSAVYGLVKGEGEKTLILTGHYDVVGVEEYGVLKEYAFSVDKLEEELKKSGNFESLSEEVQRDLESGEWIFGRGTADMKGGLAVGLAVLDEMGRQILNGKRFSGSLLFLAVPDEESYSAGMRGAVALLKELKKNFHLEYECLIDLEPNSLIDGKQEVFVGSVGKCMPVVLVQGAKAHVGNCFQGLSAAGLLASVFMETELSADFAESYDGEACMPPTWLQMRDMKKEYDVSVPYRAGGYFNMLSYSMTPEEVMGKLKNVCIEAAEAYQKRMEDMWKKLQEKAEASENEKGKAEKEKAEKAVSEAKLQCPGAQVPVSIMTVEELLDFCKKCRKSGDCEDEFQTFYEKLYRDTEEKIHSGKWNYPEATMEMMKALLDYSGISAPTVVLGFAPPYYPAFHSDMLPGKGDAGSRWFQAAASCADELGITLKKKHYFAGISDLSYCGISRRTGAALEPGMEKEAENHTKNDAENGVRPETAEMEYYGKNAPLWGKVYQIDFASIADLNIPALLFGPISKDIHQRTERVNRKSLTKDIPEILMKLLEQTFANC